MSISFPINKHIERAIRAMYRVIEQELHKNAAVITKVSETASKEYAIESALDKMQGAWASVKLVVEEYRETGQFTLRSYSRYTEGARSSCNKIGRKKLRLILFSHDG